MISPFHTLLFPTGAVFHPESVGRLPRLGVPGDRAVAGAPHAHHRHVLRLQHHPHQVSRPRILAAFGREFTA